MEIQVNCCSILECTFGTIKPPLISIPFARVFTMKLPASMMFDVFPFIGIPTFGMCQTPSNPMVAAMIAASQGRNRQAPCIPMTFFPWFPIPDYFVGILPGVKSNAKTACLWGGVVSFVMPMNFTVFVKGLKSSLLGGFGDGDDNDDDDENDNEASHPKSINNGQADHVKNKKRKRNYDEGDREDDEDDEDDSKIPLKTRIKHKSQEINKNIDKIKKRDSKNSIKKKKKH